MIFTRFARAQRPASTLALSLALATGGAVVATAFEVPASAQRTKKKEEEAPKASYSKEFVALYTPLKTDSDAAGADAAALKARIPALLALAVSNDEKMAGGQIAYNIGVKAQDVALQVQGLDLMLASGKLPADKIGSIYFAAGQLAQNAGDFAGARARYEQAQAAGYSADDVLAMISESYFAEDNVAAGVDVLDKAIAAKVAAGQPIPESWLKRGLSMTYNAQLGPQSAKYGALLAQHYPTPDSWADAINIQRNTFDYQDQEMLDLMRLAQRASTLRTERDYVDYISAADARRLPGEVSRVIAAGIAAGKLKSNDVFVSEAQSVANGRIKADQGDLPGLERDARAAGATVLTASAAGDAFLSYGQAAKAEEFYTIALTKPGVDTPRVLTRLGIAQFDQGKYAEAQATFAKVQGQREPIARLWGVYAGQKMP